MDCRILHVCVCVCVYCIYVHTHGGPRFILIIVIIQRTSIESAHDLTLRAGAKPGSTGYWPPIHLLTTLSHA